MNKKINCLYTIAFAAVSLVGCGGGADSSDTSTAPAPTASNASSPAATCVPNKQKDCQCLDGAEGKQTCAKDGKSYSDCVCVAKPDAGTKSDAGGDVPKCVTDDDCAKGNSVCLTFKCHAVGTCFAFERDDDGDNHSLCAGGKPGSYDCDDNDPTVFPEAVEICDGKDNDCDGEVDEGCATTTSAAYCEPWSTDPQVYGYRGCCGTFAKATVVEPGYLIKGSLPAIYYYASNGKRYVFPTSVILDSWYAPLDTMSVPFHDFNDICNGVRELTDAELAAITIGGNVTMRPGAYITGISTDPKRYVVDTNHTLRWASPDLLEKIYPGTVASRTHLMPDAFFINFLMGSSLSSADEYVWLLKYPQADIEVELGIK